MPDTKKIFNEIADRLAVYPVDAMVIKLRTVAAMLEFVPSYSQEDAVKAAFGIEEGGDA